jgi:hypothetical protein
VESAAHIGIKPTTSGDKSQHSINSKWFQIFIKLRFQFSKSQTKSSLAKSNKVEGQEVNSKTQVQAKQKPKAKPRQKTQKWQSFSWRQEAGEGKAIQA